VCSDAQKTSARFNGVSFTMNRILLLGVFLCSDLSAAEIEKCPDREVVSWSMLKAPRVTELKEGSVFLSGLVDEDGKVNSAEILSQKGDLRWGKQAVKAMEETIFEPADKACEFEYLYTAKFEGNDKEN
jgi:TonB family protein